jgi:hypothetical protein
VICRKNSTNKIIIFHYNQIKTTSFIKKDSFASPFVLIFFLKKKFFFTWGKRINKKKNKRTKNKKKVHPY